MVAVKTKYLQQDMIMMYLNPESLSFEEIASQLFFADVSKEQQDLQAWVRNCDSTCMLVEPPQGLFSSTEGQQVRLTNTQSIDHVFLQREESLKDPKTARPDCSSVSLCWNWLCQTCTITVRFQATAGVVSNAEADAWSLFWAFMGLEGLRFCGPHACVHKHA